MLREDLVLADDGALEAGRDAEQVPHGVASDEQAGAGRVLEPGALDRGAAPVDLDAVAGHEPEQRPGRVQRFESQCKLGPPLRVDPARVGDQRPESSGRIRRGEEGPVAGRPGR